MNDGSAFVCGLIIAFVTIFALWIVFTLSTVGAKSDIVHDCNTFGRFEVHGKIYVCSEQKTP